MGEFRSLRRKSRRSSHPISLGLTQGSVSVRVPEKRRISRFFMAGLPIRQQAAAPGPAAAVSNGKPGSQRSREPSPPQSDLPSDSDSESSPTPVDNAETLPTTLHPRRRTPPELKMVTSSQPAKSILKRGIEESRRPRHTTLADTLVNTSRNRLMELSDVSALLSPDARYHRRHGPPQRPARGPSLAAPITANDTKITQDLGPGPPPDTIRAVGADDIPDLKAAPQESIKTVRFSRVDIHMFKIFDEQDSESDDDVGSLGLDGMAVRPCEPICAN